MNRNTSKAPKGKKNMKKMTFEESLDPKNIERIQAEHFKKITATSKKIINALNASHVSPLVGLDSLSFVMANVLFGENQDTDKDDERMLEGILKDIQKHLKSIRNAKP